MRLAVRVHMKFAEELEVWLYTKQLVETLFGVLVVAFVVRPGMNCACPGWNYMSYNVPAVLNIAQQPDAGFKAGAEDDVPDFRQQFSGQYKKRHHAHPET